MQPIIFVLLFAYVFGGAIRVSSGSYIDFLLPGILVQTATFSGLNTGLAVAQDLRNGLMDRFWSLPMSRFAVVVGRIVVDTLLSAVGVLTMIGVGTVIGFRFHAGLLEALAAIGIAVLAGATFGTVGSLLAVILRTPEAIQGVGFAIIFPVVFASSVFVPVSTMPSWLQWFAARTPITATVDAVRAHLATVERHTHGDQTVCADCAAHLAEVAALYRGAFLSQLSLPDSVAFEEWALITRERLHEQVLDALSRDR